jgi:uncharacterized protein (DUF2132 family)
MNEAVGSDELDRARQELAELERAVEELPQILEEKFRQRLWYVRQINHQLLIEQASLESRLTGSSLGFWRTPWMRALVVALVCAVLAGLGWGAARQLGLGPPALRQAQRNGDRLQAAGPLSTSILQVQAQGSSWLEVQDLRSHAVLFIGVLEAGQSRTIRLRQGLRLRSGRPDLLTLRIDDAQPEPFGLSQGQDWRTVMPPELRTAGA